MNRKPRPGEPFRPDRRMQGELSDIRDYNRTFPTSHKGGKGLTAPDQGRVLLENNLGETLPKFSIVRIGDRTIDADASDDRLRAYENATYHEIEEPDGSINDPIAILLSPINDGSIGKALGVGVTQCDINFTKANTDYPFARSIAGDTEKLLADQEGNVEILSPRSVTSTGVHRCLVRLIGGWSYSEEGFSEALQEGGCECYDECADQDDLVITIDGLGSVEGGTVNAAYRYRINVELAGDPMWGFASGEHVLTWSPIDGQPLIYRWLSAPIQGPCPGVPASEPDTYYQWNLTFVNDSTIDGTLGPHEVTLVLAYLDDDNPETQEDCYDTPPTWVDLYWWNAGYFDPGCGNLFELNPLYMLRSQVSWYGGPIQCKICVEPTIGTHVLEGSSDWCAGDPNAVDDLEASLTYGISGWGETAAAECCCELPYSLLFPEGATEQSLWDFVPTEWEESDGACTPPGMDSGVIVARLPGGLGEDTGELDCFLQCSVSGTICLGYDCDHDEVNYENYRFMVTMGYSVDSGGSVVARYLSDWMTYDEAQAALLGGFTVTLDDVTSFVPVTCFDAEEDVPTTLTVNPF